MTMMSKPQPAPRDTDALTQDGFLGGRLRLWQPRHGYRAATDPVLLAAAIPAQAGDQVLDLGCGVGAAALCLAARVSDLQLTGLEVQLDYAALARRNAAETALPLDVLTGDVTAPPAHLRARQFDHVLTNPPFYGPSATTAPNDPGRDQAHREGAAGLEAFIDLALKRLRPGGTVTVIHRAERLGDILACLAPRTGDARVLPLAARAGRAAKRVIVQARKDRRGPLVLLAPLILHEGAIHERDGASYTSPVRGILEDAQALSLDPQ